MEESSKRAAKATSPLGQPSEALAMGRPPSEQALALAIASQAGRALPKHKYRLLSHDYIIVWNTARVTFGRWQDRLMAVIMLVGVLAVTRSWLSTQSWKTTSWAALLTGIIFAAGAGRRVHARLHFHACDGLLAADAMNPGKRRSYIAAWHSVGLTLLLAATVLLRLSLAAPSVAGYLTGALAAEMASGLGEWRRLVRGRPASSMLAWSNSPSTGVVAAAILVIVLVGARNSQMTQQMALAGMGTISLALALSRVDDQTVRFMAIAGHGTRRIVTYNAKGLASFFAVVVPASYVLLGLLGMALVAVLSSAMLLLLTLRILAYRLHGRRVADTLVSILAGLLTLAAYWIPPALPVIACAVLWHLHRSGRARTWLLG